MLEAIRKTNPNTDYMYVVDTRPRVSYFKFIWITLVSVIYQKVVFKKIKDFKVNFKNITRNGVVKYKAQHKIHVIKKNVQKNIKYAYKIIHLQTTKAKHILKNTSFRITRDF